MPSTPPPESSSAAAHDLLSILDIEMLDRDLFRGPVGSDTTELGSLFGGQVAAQALRAAGLTVSGDRWPHSLHGYFLRRGLPERPVILQVSRDRDGASFSSRRVIAKQNGEVIFSMLASFHVDEDSGSYQTEGSPDIVAPEEFSDEGLGYLVEVREVHRGSEDHSVQSDRMWVRVPVPMPDDRLLHACALAYVSDLGTGFGRVSVQGLAPGGPSIDHAVWFHRPIRLDDWVMLDLWPMMAGGARGVYLGTVRSRDGSLAAMLSQEMLLRPR